MSLWLRVEVQTMPRPTNVKHPELPMAVTH